MSPDQIFSFANTAALVPWLLMMLAPRWKWTRTIIFSFAFSILFAALYIIMMFSYFIEMGDFTTLEGIAEMFSIKELALIGWLHYLAFDLFVGSWELHDAQRIGLTHLLLVPCLLFTFILGPVGLLLYLIIRWIKTKELVVEM